MSTDAEPVFVIAASVAHHSYCCGGDVMIPPTIFLEGTIIPSQPECAPETLRPRVLEERVLNAVEQ